MQRMTKNGMRRFDARGPVGGRTSPRSVSSPPGRQAVLRVRYCDVVVRHTTPAVRPDDVLEALRQVADLAPPVPPR